MRNFGWLISLGGVALCIYALFMDVSVPAGDGYRVTNIGLMSDRQNYLIIAGMLFVGGILISNRHSHRRSRGDYKDYNLSDLHGGNFVTCEGGINTQEINQLSIYLIEKHNGKPVGDIMLMNIPFIDRIANEMPSSLGKSFRTELERCLKYNI